MKRSLMSVFGAGLAIAALTALWTTVDGITAQEANTRVFVGPSSGALTLLGGSGGYLGVSILEMNEERAEEVGMSREYGAYVASVVDDGPAGEAGLEEGDVIVGWNGARLESTAQLQRLTRETPPGRAVELTVFRDGRERDISVDLGDRADANVFTVPGGGGRVELRRPTSLRTLVRPQGRGVSFAFSRRGRLGASIQSLGDQLAEYFGVDGGALVTSVSEDSPAEAAGLRAGDVIVQFAGETVEDPGDLMEILSDQDAGDVRMRVIRDGASVNLTVELEEAERGRFGDGDGSGFQFFWGDGEDLSVEPFTMDGFEIGPIQFDGWEMDAHDWDLDLGEHFESLKISIPRIEIPGFEMPMMEMPDFEIPGFHMQVSRVQIRV